MNTNINKPTIMNDEFRRYYIEIVTQEYNKDNRSFDINLINSSGLNHTYKLKGGINETNKS